MSRSINVRTVVEGIKIFASRRLWVIGILLYCSFPIFSQGNLTFKENKGQWPEEVLYGATTSNGTIYFLENGLLFDICEPSKSHAEKGIVTKEDGVINCHSFKLNFNLKIDKSSIIASNPLPTKYNYLIGDKSRWASNIPAYQVLDFKEIAPGISLRFYGNDGDLKYDIIANSSLSLSQLSFTYEGVKVKEEYGNIKLITSVGEYIESIPLAFTQKSKTNISCRYIVEDNNIRYKVDENLEQTEGIVVDPILIFSTYSGSTADNWGSTATFDEAGNLYSGGISEVQNLGGTFPATLGAYQRENAGFWDVAITKYDSLGSVPIYSTLLGGSNSELVQSLVVNSKNQLVIMGVTSSLNFPVSPNAPQPVFGGGIPLTVIGGVSLSNGSDIFVTILSEDGSEIIGSTYMGGSNNDGIMTLAQKLTKNYGDESRGDVFTDESDNVFIASKTSSDDFPVLNGFQAVGSDSLDAVVVKFNSDMSSVEWSSYLGGSGNDAAYSIKKNEADQIIIAGGTTSPDFQGNFLNAHSGDIDGWVAILDGDGSQMVAGKYMGTALYEQAYFIDLDPFDNIYCFGQSSGNYPVMGNVYSQGDGQFIQKFSADLSQNLLSTEFGSINPGPDISPTAFLVNDCGNIYVSGWAGSVNNAATGYIGGSTFGMPVTLDAFQPVTQGSDFYLGVFVDDAADLLYGTFLGGNTSKTHVDGGTSRFDSQGIVYHAVCAGCRAYTNATVPEGWSDFPTTSGAWSNQNNSANCNNAAFKFDLSSLRAKFRTNTPELDQPEVGFVCMPDSLVFENLSVGGETFQWDFGDGRKIITTENENITHQYLSPGNYRVKLKIIDRSTCIEEDSTFQDVVVYQPQMTLPEDRLLCEGESFILSVTGATNVSWYNPEGSLLSSQNSVSGTPSEDLEYILEARYQQCIETDTLLVDVIPRGGIDAFYERECKSEREIKFFATLEDDMSGIWEFGDGQGSDELNPVYTYAADGNYTAKFVASREHCEFPILFPVDAFEIAAPSVFTPGIRDTYNDSFKIRGTENISLEVFNRWGGSIFFDEDYKNDWTAEEIEAGTYYYLITTENGSSCKGWVQVIK